MLKASSKMHRQHISTCSVASDIDLARAVYWTQSDLFLHSSVGMHVFRVLWLLTENSAKMPWSMTLCGQMSVL